MNAVLVVIVGGTYVSPTAVLEFGFLEAMAFGFKGNQFGCLFTYVLCFAYSTLVSNRNVLVEAYANFFGCSSTSLLSCSSTSLASLDTHLSHA